jgi:hypothetical protein
MPVAPASYLSNQVKVAVGTLYVAPLGTTEPSGVSGAWPSTPAPGWIALGYTDQGSELDFGPTTTDVTVEEEVYPVFTGIDTYTAKMTFVLAEPTAFNLIIALNGGVPGPQNPTATSMQTAISGGVKVEPPTPGAENRVMIGWDALPKASTGSTGGDPFGRLICRQCFQTGQIKRVMRRGNNKAMFACEFNLEKPPTAQPYAFFMNNSMLGTVVS